jgi:anti-sigma factor RsiW
VTRHLSKEQLLRHLDGEMSISGMRRAAAHLQTCWSCQVEFNRLKEHIAAIIDAHVNVFSPSLPPPGAPWPRLEPRLERARRSELPSLWRRTIASCRVSWGVQFAVGTLVSALALIVFRVFAPATTVPAKEVLDRANAADSRRLAIVGQSVIRQRVRVKRAGVGASTQQTARLESWKSAKSAYWNFAADPVNSDLFDRYRQNGLASALPLSPPALQSWLKLAGSEPSASTTGQNIQVHVSSNEPARAHGLEEISFQVQKAAWHLDRMTLSFADATFQIVEEDSSIMDLREVPDDVAAQLEPAAAERDQPSMKTPAAAVVNLDDLEMSVRFGLHGIAADLVESIEIAAEPPGRLVVNAWNASSERKQQLSTLFAGMPGVQLDFQPPAASTKAAKTVMSDLASEDAQPRDPRLEQLFQGTVTLETYTRPVLEAGNGVLEHFYALQDLAVRWPAEKDPTLSRNARAQLIAMVRDHARDIRAGLSGWEAQMDALLKGFDYQLRDDASGGIPIGVLLPSPEWRRRAVPTNFCAHCSQRQTRP